MPFDPEYVSRLLAFYDATIAEHTDRRDDYMALARRRKTLGYTSPSDAVRLARKMNRYLRTWIASREDFLREIETFS